MSRLDVLLRLLASSLACLPCVGVVAASEARSIRIDEVEARWSEPRETGWRSLRLHEIPGAVVDVELRGTVELPREVAARQPLALEVMALATCAVRWDGVALRAAGRPGATAEAERPGPLRQVVHVPDRLATAGTHRLDLTCSAHHRGFEPTVGFWSLRVAPLRDVLLAGRTTRWVAMLSLSGMLLVGLFALATWLFDRRQAADLRLAIVCAAVAALAVAESWRRLVDYTYDWHLLRLRLVTGLSWCVAVALVAYVVRRFPRRRGGRWLAAVAVGSALAVVLAPTWDGRAILVFVLALPVAVVWCLRAARAGRPGAPWAAVGLLVCFAVLLWRPAEFIDRNLYLAVDLLLLGLLVGHAREAASVRREREAVRLEAARLEAELLRRQLQPHYLMNTLTALAEWIEEDPPTAVRMIEALAAEAKSLAVLSTRRRVRVGEELALCRRQLEVLSLRRAVDYRLETVDVDESAGIPPAVLHTLVENAVTHGGAGSGTAASGDAGASSDAGDVVRFVLRQVEGPDAATRRLVFDAPLASRAASDGTDSDPVERSGTGSRYIEARLRESYGDHWRFEHGAVDGAVDGIWRTELDLPADGAEERGR